MTNNVSDYLSKYETLINVEENLTKGGGYDKSINKKKSKKRKTKSNYPKVKKRVTKKYLKKKRGKKGKMKFRKMKGGGESTD